MGINPVQLVSSVIQNLSAHVRSSSSNLQNTPKPAPPQSSATQVPSTLAQTEVKVHPDHSTGREVLIYEFRDSQSGSLMYQIPSEQLLGLMKAIDQQLSRLKSGTHRDGL